MTQQPERMGGAPRLRLLVKANEDVTVGLLAPKTGVADLVADRYEGRFEVDLTHEAMARSDVLRAQLDGGRVPEEVDDLPLHPANRATALASDPFDVVILSMQADIEHRAWRHRESGYPVWVPDDESAWSEPQRESLRNGFEPLGLLSPEQARDNLLAIVRRVKRHPGAHILICGASSVDPGDQTHSYFTAGETTALRTHALNLAAITVSSEEGISVVDVDRLIAELGADDHVVGALRYSAEAGAAIAEEATRVIEDLGFFEERPLVPQVGKSED